jgi:hypothetical protein
MTTYPSQPVPDAASCSGRSAEEAGVPQIQGLSDLVFRGQPTTALVRSGSVALSIAVERSSIVLQGFATPSRADRRSRSAGPGRASRHDLPGWRVRSGPATDSRSRCTRYGRASIARVLQSDRRSGRPRSRTAAPTRREPARPLAVVRSDGRQWVMRATRLRARMARHPEHRSVRPWFFGTATAGTRPKG